MTLFFIDSLLQLDDRVFLLFNGVHSPFWDEMMMLITGKFIWTFMYATILAALFATRRWKAALMLTVMFLVAFAVTDYSISNFIRPYFARLRPGNPDNPLAPLVHNVHGYTGGAYGFPSCHGANSFCLAVFMSLAARRASFTIWMFFWAVIHSYTRLYLGVHYPGDLIVGAILGSITGALFYFLTMALMHRLHLHGQLRPTIDIHGLPVHPWHWPIFAGILTMAGAAVCAL